MIEFSKRGSFEALHRVLAFVTKDQLPAPLDRISPKFYEHVVTLKATMQKAQAASKVLVSDEPERCMRLRIELRAMIHASYIKPICQIARIMKSSPRMAMLKLPRSQRSESGLLECAHMMLHYLPSYLPILIELGFPSTMLQELEDAILKIENTAKRYNFLRERRRLARTRFCEALREASATKIDLYTMVVRCCQTDPINGPGTLLHWQKIARVCPPTGGPWVPMSDSTQRLHLFPELLLREDSRFSATALSRITS